MTQKPHEIEKQLRIKACCVAVGNARGSPNKKSYFDTACKQLTVLKPVVRLQRLTNNNNCRLQPLLCPIVSDLVIIDKKYEVNVEDAYHLRNRMIPKMKPTINLRRKYAKNRLLYTKQKLRDKKLTEIKPIVKLSRIDANWGLLNSNNNIEFQSKLKKSLKPIIKTQGTKSKIKKTVRFGKVEVKIIECSPLVNEFPIKSY